MPIGDAVAAAFASNAQPFQTPDIAHTADATIKAWTAPEFAMKCLSRIGKANGMSPWRRA